MGYKRHLDEFEELPCKRSQRLDSMSEMSPEDTMVKPHNLGRQEDCFYDIRWYDVFNKGRPTDCAKANYEDHLTNAHFRSCNEDDTCSGATSLSSLSSDSVEFGNTHTKCLPVVENDVFLDYLPRRLVPIGPNHQAILPTWGESVDETSKKPFAWSSAFGTNITSQKEMFLGKAIVMMPDTDLCCEGNEVGSGRSDCNCADCGSIRCVRQHVMKARQNLKKKLGPEAFVNLGFTNMGEEVACCWSEEEGEVFHEIVYSYPPSVGRNFWKHLPAVFPSRTKNELVSYYFNVFMLHKRAAQNRIKSQSIDSDDDEFRDSDVISYHLQVSEENDDSDVVSFDDLDVSVKNPADFCDDLEHDEDEGDCMDDFENDYDNMDQSAGCTMNFIRKEGNADEIQQVKEDFSQQDDSCTSFDSQNDAVGHCNVLNPAASVQGGGFKSDCVEPMPGKSDTNVFANHSYFLEPCESKDWYPRYLIGLATGADFLPTSNIIEEIFGQGSPEEKARND